MEEGHRMEHVLKVESFQIGPLENNAFLVIDPESREAALVDPGMGSEILSGVIAERGLRVTAILNTHAHFDHTYNNQHFRQTLGCPLLLHESDLQLLRDMSRHAALFGFPPRSSPDPDAFLTPGQEVRVGGGALRVLHTPGHTQGGVSFAAPGLVITGDTLFAQSIGRTDLPGGNYDQLVESIRTALYALPESTEVYPGHGPATLIGYEKRHNPFVKGLPAHVL
jgi:glyoxylase-like metal-dependent hydrolase (beta-lactamase superfamily II)